MSKDVVPELLTNIEKYYNSGIKNSLILSAIQKKVKSGTANFKDADLYAKEVARILSSAYEKHITDETLPDGIFYYNIAKRILEPTMKRAIAEIDDISAAIHNNKNKKAGIGLKAVVPEINQDRIDEIINKLSEEASNEQ